jgi:hypothetical protein
VNHGNTIPQRPTGGNSRGKRILIVAGLIVIAAATLFVLRIRSHVVAQSDSPDGLYRVVVTEQPPPLFTSSPYRYTFTVWTLPSAMPLFGAPHTRNTDSAVLGDCSFQWASNFVTVSTPESDPKQVSATLSKTAQRWKIQ